MSVIVVIKDLNGYKTIGGIAHYYKSIRKHQKDIIYFEGKSSVAQKGILLSLLLIIRDYFVFAICLAKNRHIKLVQLTPSLDPVGICRDSVFIFISMLFRKKFLVFIRGWHAYIERIIENNCIIRYLFKKVYSRASAFIVLSNSFKSKLRKWGLSLPIYIETTIVSEESKTQYRTLSDKEQTNQINILFLARIEKAKGIVEALEAYQMLRQKHLNISLTIAGNGSYLAEIKKFVSDKNPEVRFKGYVSGEEKDRTFAESDIYLFPTYHGEGMPNSVLEAMAFGLPVITRPVGGLKDFFEDGKMGFLTESKDPKVFADLIEKLIQNSELRNQMSEYNAVFARKHFLASNVAKRMENIYNDVLEGKAADKSWMDADGISTQNRQNNNN